MKLAIFADIHMMGNRHAEQSGILRSALAEAQRRGVQQVLCAGDVFDRAAVLDRHAIPSTVVRSFLDPVEEAGIPWLLVDGNHDVSHGRDLPATCLLESSPLVTVAHEVKGTVVGTPCDFARVLCLPWQDARRGEKSKEECLALLRDLAVPCGADFTVLLGHCEVRGSVNSYRTILEGDTFWFTNEDLESVGADLIALGHYHKRQQHYVGALCQLNHGESGNPAGWLYVDTATGEREFVAVDAPRYYTVGAGHYRPQDYRDWDRVVVEGVDRPADLAAGHVFRPLTEAKVAAKRAPGIDGSARLDVLLDRWAEQAGVTERSADLQEELAQVAGRDAGAAEMIAGSLTRIDGIAVEGFGPHRRTILRFEDEGRVAMVGENGAGKSTVLEAVAACFYGDWVTPARGSLRTLLTADEGRLTVDFQAHGQCYTALRRITAAGKSEAFLYQDGVGNPVAGPKVTDFAKAVENLVGPKDLFLGSVFLSQKAEGDVVGAGQSDRQAFVRRYLGLDRFDPLAQQAKTLADRYDGSIANLQAQVDSLPAAREKVPEAQQSLVTAREQASLAETLAQAVEEALGVIRAEGEALGVQDGARKSAAEKVAQAEKREAEAAGAVLALHNRCVSLRGDLAGEEKCREEAARVAGFQAELDALRSVDSARALAEARRREAQAEVDRWDRAVSAERERIATEERGARNGAEALDTRADDIEKRTAHLANLGCAAKPLPCPLVDSARAEAGQVAGLRQHAQEARQLADTLAQRILAGDYAQEEREGMGAALRVLQGLPPVPSPADPAEVRRVESRLADCRRAEKELARLEEVRRSLGVAEADLAVRRQEQAAALLALEEAQSALAAAPDVTARLAELRAEYEAVSATLRTRRQEALDRAREAGIAEKALQDAQDRVEQLEALAEQLASEKATAGRFRLLQRAFGKDGLPQLLIHEAIPALQAILDEVCAVDFGGRFGVRFDTTRTLASGESREAFAILFSRNGREYDARGCSGGEEAAVRAALRTAFVLYQAERSAAGYRVAFLDEPAAPCDSEMSEAVLGMLRRLGDRFEQVFVVSHDAASLAEFDRVVVLGEEMQSPIQTREALVA